MPTSANSIFRRCIKCGTASLSDNGVYGKSVFTKFASTISKFEPVTMCISGYLLSFYSEFFFIGDRLV
ncbi:hypothetical protein Hdeb2414_s0024g00648671 [Helianthus debilis subsp. tardiflorus]